MQTEDRTMKSVNDQPSGNLPFLKPDDIQYFDKLLVNVISFMLIKLAFFFELVAMPINLSGFICRLMLMSQL